MVPSDEVPDRRSDLIEHLRSMIITLPITDKKYRETLPKIVRDLPTRDLSDGEAASFLDATKAKVRRSKKGTIGKDGLWFGEDANVIKWWLTCNSSLAIEPEDQDLKIQTALLEQRTRETKIQIILILETMALESGLSRSEAAEQTMPQVDPASQDMTTVGKKPKKPQNLHTLLDLLADRLCIWHSMTTSPKKSSTERKAEGAPGSSNNAARADQLRQFCIDVVIPLYVDLNLNDCKTNDSSYAARLPKECSGLCQKLGMSTGQSPQASRNPPSSDETKVATKPGTRTKRSPTRRHRRTLERVLTEDRTAQRRPSIPSLSRSSTELAIHQLKREVSDTTLSSIPLNRVVMTKWYTQREVDMHGNSQANEAKLKKQTVVDEQLKSAIATLKKPNPRAAVKEIVEAAEQRQLAQQNKSERNACASRIILMELGKRKPLSASLARQVQIQATPSRHELQRQGSVLISAATSERTTSHEGNELEEISPSSVVRIPSTSVVRSSKFKPAAPRRIDPNSRLVEQTPTRGPGKFVHRMSHAFSKPAALQVPSVLVKSLANSTDYNSNTRTTGPGNPLEMTRPVQTMLVDHLVAAETPRRDSTQRNDASVSLPLIEVTPGKSVTDDMDSEPTEQIPFVEDGELYSALGWTNDYIDD